MPLPLLPLLGLGAGVGSSLFNAFSQGRQNRLQRNFTSDMYNRQRADALTDAAFQRDYDSPANQMRRFKEAGLNPNLIYGQGNAGSFDMPRGASGGGYNSRAPELDLQSPVMGYIDIQQRQAQADNVKAATDVARGEVILKSLQSLGIIKDNAQKELNQQFQKETWNYALEQVRENLRQTMVNTTVTSARNERETLLNAQTLAKGVEEILIMRLQQAKSQQERELLIQQIELLKKENTLKQFDVNLSQEGIRPSDPIIWRKGQQLLNWLRKNIFKF